MIGNRDVRNEFFKFGSVSIRFLEKTQIRFGFGLEKTVGSVFFVDQL